LEIRTKFVRKLLQEENREVELQSISLIFYKQLLCRYYFASKIQSQTVNKEKFHKTLLHEKAGCKMLVNLTPGRFAIMKLVQSVAVAPICSQLKLFSCFSFFLKKKCLCLVVDSSTSDLEQMADFDVIYPFKKIERDLNFSLN